MSKEAYDIYWDEWDIEYSSSACHSIVMSDGCGEECPIFIYDTCPYALEGFEDGTISMTAMLETGHFNESSDEYIRMYANGDITLGQYLDTIRFEWGIDGKR